MIIFCDIDGVIADVGELCLKYLPDWDEYFRHTLEAIPIQPVIDLLREVRTGNTVCLITGRPESNRNLTNQWIRAHVIPSGYFLLMRDSQDPRATWEIKVEWITRYRSELEKCLVLEDEPRAVLEFQNRGIPVIQVSGYRISPNDQIPFGKGEQLPNATNPKIH